METKVEFMSDGVKLVGMLFQPTGATGKLPIVVAAGGWCYTKEIVLPHIARFVNEKGVQFLAFDYAGFGESEGARRQHLDPWQQISDYQNALTYAESRDDVDPQRMAAIDSRVKAVVSVVPVIDGYANMRRVHGEKRFADYQKAILEDRRERGRGAIGTKIAFATTTPETELSVWPFARVNQVFLELQKTEAPLHQHWSTMESAELLLNYSVHPFLNRILDKKVMMVVAEGDNITAWDLEIETFNKVPSPHKRLEILPSVSHMSLYSEKADTNIAGRQARDWFAIAFGSSSI